MSQPAPEQQADLDLWWRPPALRPRPRTMALIGRAVLRLRLYHGWSQRDLEYRAKVDQTTISRLERGQQTGLSIRRLAAIVDALHAGDVVFDKPRALVPPSSWEEVVHGDRWERACREADRRLRWPSGGAG